VRPGWPAGAHWLAYRHALAPMHALMFPGMGACLGSQRCGFSACGNAALITFGFAFSFAFIFAFRFAFAVVRAEAP